MSLNGTKHCSSSSSIKATKTIATGMNEKEKLFMSLGKTQENCGNKIFGCCTRNEKNKHGKASRTAFQ